MTPSNTQTKIIVFPAGMPESITFFQNNTDKLLVGASAIQNDQANDLYDQWEYIPYVDTPDFDTSMLSLIERVKPEAIFCPHRFASHYVRTLVSEHNLKVKIFGTDDKELLDFKHQQSNLWYESYEAAIQKLSIPDSQKLNKTELIAVVRHALSIPGETGTEKIISLLAIGASIPPGDVVEIGCLYGRTSFVFGWLAQRYRIGSTLCIDPWTTEAAIHEDTSSKAQDAIRLNYEYDSIFHQFKENLIPSFYSTLNYIRNTSHNAASIFKENKKLKTDEFGSTEYKQSISCLHIDGNHDFSAVLDDLHQWSPLLQSDGWLILDDYNWPFGDGPKMVGNEILETNRDRIGCSFISGDALFIKFKTDINTSHLFSNKPAAQHS